MLENNLTPHEMGTARLQATLEGSKEVSLYHPIRSDVFARRRVHPGPFQGWHSRTDAAQIRPSQFIVRRCCDIGIVSHHVDAMMCSRILKPHVDVKHGRLFLASERAFDAVAGRYGSSRRWVSVAKGCP